MPSQSSHHSSRRAALAAFAARQLASPAFANAAKGSYRRRIHLKPCRQQKMPRSMKDKVAALTPRPRQVVRLISLGCTIDEIAAILDVAPNTADNQRARAMRTLGTNKAALLTRIAIKYGISSINDRLTLVEKRRSGRKRDGWN